MKTIKERLTLNKSGVVLMSVMIILLVMTIIISGVVFITVANLENSQKTASHTESYYVAEGGVNYLTQTFETFYATVPTATSTEFFTAIDNFAATYPVSNKQVIPFSNNKGKTSQALVWITPLAVTDPSIHRYQIFSDGYIGNVKRTLSKIIEVSYINGGLAFNDAVLSVGTLIVGGAHIEGSIQTTSTATPAVTFRGGGYVDAIYIPTGTVPTDIVDSSNYNNSIPGLGTSGIYQAESPVLNPIEILTAPTTTTKLKNFVFTSGGKSYQIINNGNFSITSNTNIDIATTYNLGDENPGQDTFYVSSFKVSEYAPNFTLEINRDITIVTDTLWLNNQLKVTGSGTLTIFVKPSQSNTSVNTSLQISSNKFVGHQDDSTKMIIHVGALTYKDGSTYKPWLLTMGSGTFYFNLICANLNVDLNDSTLKGVLATNALAANATKISNVTANVFIGPSSASSAVLIYAMDAIVAMKSSSSRFYGAIVAGSFTSDTGNSSPEIYYRPVVNSYIPIDIIDLSDMNTPPTITVVKSPTLE